MSPKAPRAPTLLVCGALTLGILLIYAPVRNFEFVSFDDPQYVIDNPAVEAGLTVDGLVRAFTGSHAANWHPLSWLSHMLDVEVFGLRAGGHHVTSVLLHLASSLLLFAILTGMTGRTWPSAFVAMVFAFHPLRVGHSAYGHSAYYYRARSLRNLRSQTLASLTLPRPPRAARWRGPVLRLRERDAPACPRRLPPRRVPRRRLRLRLARRLALLVALSPLT